MERDLQPPHHDFEREDRADELHDEHVQRQIDEEQHNAESLLRQQQESQHDNSDSQGRTL